jgi:hypothetical protein
VNDQADRKRTLEVVLKGVPEALEEAFARLPKDSKATNRSLSSLFGCSSK